MKSSIFQNCAIAPILCKVHKANISTYIFCKIFQGKNPSNLLFWKIDDFINSFWLNLTFRTFDKWNFKPKISSIFHVDQVTDGWMSHVFGVKLSLSIIFLSRESFFIHTFSFTCFFVFMKLKIFYWLFIQSVKQIDKNEFSFY